MPGPGIGDAVESRPRSLQTPAEGQHAAGRLDQFHFPSLSLSPPCQDGWSVEFYLSPVGRRVGPAVYSTDRPIVRRTRQFHEIWNKQHAPFVFPLTQPIEASLLPVVFDRLGRSNSTRESS